MALIFIILALLSFVTFGVGSGSSGSGHPLKPHRVNCKARMSSGESRRDCGGPPVNP